MEFTADHIGSENNAENVSFGFYSNERMYGVGFCRIHSENRIELMVADQSVYDLKQAEIIFFENSFELKLPKGTIKNSDGDDYYKINYSNLKKNEYQSYLIDLKAILEVNRNVDLIHS